MGEEKRMDSSPASDSGIDVSLDVIPIHSTNLLTVLDENGIIRYESPSIQRIFGFTQDELVGMQVAEFFHPADRDRVVSAFRAVVESETHRVESVEYRHKQADGSYQWVESAASANPTPEGHYVINTRDISERKEREQELKETNERLDQFAKVVSHDLKNPLNVATGRLGLAMEESDGGHLSEVARAHERMEMLIENLLAIAQFGDEVDKVESIDFAELVENCLQNVTTVEASLVIDVDCVIEADRSRLQQLVENLLKNAVFHGGDDVTITVGELEDGTGFYIEDDGPGIAEELRDQVFESGYSTRENGTGFGLTIVAEIVEAHGWEIMLSESTTGGARFEIAGVEFQ